MKQLLALDFDGVISDSAPECFWVALRTYLDMRPSTLFGASIPISASRVELPARMDIEAMALYRDFVDLMPLGNRAEDFGVILSVLDSGAEGGTSVADQSSYDVARRRVGEAFLVEFHERFYATRRAVANREPAAWERLMGPYPGFVSLLRDRPRSIGLAVATAKDRGSVLRLLDLYGLLDQVPQDRILDKETGVSKRSHLVELARRTGMAFKFITFVDDKVNHLDAVAPLGVRCCLATWGYNGDREHSLALERGYALCDLETAGSTLFDAG